MRAIGRSSKRWRCICATPTTRAAPTSLPWHNFPTREPSDNSSSLATLAKARRWRRRPKTEVSISRSPTSAPEATDDDEDQARGPRRRRAADDPAAGRSCALTGDGGAIVFRSHNQRSRCIHPGCLSFFLGRRRSFVFFGQLAIVPPPLHPTLAFCFIQFRSQA